MGKFQPINKIDISQHTFLYRPLGLKDFLLAQTILIAYGGLKIGKLKAGSVSEEIS